MRLRYNGIEMQIMQTVDHHREVVFDDSGVDPLYIHVLLNVNAVINGQMDAFGNLIGMTYQPVTVLNAQDPNTYVPPQDKLPPTLAVGQNRPGLTDAAILEALLTPRRTLVLYAMTPDGPEVHLQSPAPGLGTDARSGPNPLRADIIGHFGEDQTWQVNFQVETFLPPCPSSAALLSNRFTQWHDLDPDYNLTIRTEGTAHFRRDMLQALSLNPDLLRRWLVLPVPLGFQRLPLEFGQSPDGLSYYYSIADVQQPQVFVAGNAINATRVMTNYTQVISSPGDKLESALGGIERGINLRLNRKWLREGNKPPHAGAGSAVHGWAGRPPRPGA